MEKKMIWAYFLQLSMHMWEDEYTPPRGWYLDKGYHEENVTDISVWDEMVSFIAERKFNICVVDVGDGIKYESHPEISAPDAWDKDFLKKKLDEMRGLGIEPIPKLNFSACHDVWMKRYRFMINSPEYFAFCADVIAEVCEAFGWPRLFHLGLDEENIANQGSCDIITIRNEDMWWKCADFLFAECEKHGARPWVWSDYYWDHPDLFVKHMPKSVLQSNWYYGNIRDYPADSYGGRAVSAYLRLEELGYDQVPSTSTWNNNATTLQTLALGKDKISPDRLKGYMTIPWTSTSRSEIYTLKNDAERFYLARKKLYPESFEVE